MLRFSRKYMNGMNLVRKKIVLITGSMSGGGAERVLSNLANHYVNKGFSVDIITLLDNKVGYDLPKEVTLKHISTKKNKNIVKPFKWMKEIRTHLKKSKNNIVISFFSKINLLSLIATFGLSIPIYISERNDPKNDGRSIFISLLTYLLYPFSRGIIFQTHYAKECFPQYIQRKSTVIPNPVNIDFDFSKKRLYKKRIVSVGKLMEQKNHKMLIEAFDLFIRKFPDYTLHIYGQGHLRETLANLIDKKGLTDQIILEGRTNKVFDIVYNAELFVLSSNYEGLSNALIEAMLLGTPVISTRCAGSTELIKNGVSGQLVDINDYKNLSIKMEEAINNYEKSKSMALHAQESLTDFTDDKVFKMWDNFILNM